MTAKSEQTSDAKANSATQESEQQSFNNLSQLAEYAPEKQVGAASEGGGVDGAASAEELAVLYRLSFMFMATRKGAHWMLNEGTPAKGDTPATPSEAAALGEATDAVLRKYLPEMKLGPEVGLALISLSVLLPRVMIDMDEKKAAEKSGEKSNGN